MIKLHVITLSSMIACCSLVNAAPSINSNMELLVDGKPFFIRGMNYAPETLGWPSKPNTKPGDPYNNQFISKGPQGQLRSNGLWFCSGTNEYANNDWVSACDDNDLTGTLTLNSAANMGWNKSLTKRWETDLGRLHDLGVNTIRLYDVQAGAVDGKLPKDHKKFLDVAKAKGIYVIFPALTDYVKSNANKNNLLKISVTNLVKETCGHPALLAYNVGNEFEIDSPSVQKSVKEAIGIVRSACPTALVTYSIEDVVQGNKAWTLHNGSSAALELLGNSKTASNSGTKSDGIDFLMVNEYRNSGNGGLEGYSGSSGLFSQMKEVAEAYRIPLAIGETGEYDDQRFKSDWYNDQWKFTLKNAKANYVLGSLYFTYNDEPIKKAGNQRFMGIVTPAWPSESANMDQGYIDVPDIEKKADYVGIKPFVDRTVPSALKTITYPDSSYTVNGNKKGVGAGRFDMFSDRNRCNYLTGQDTSSITGPCAK